MTRTCFITLLLLIFSFLGAYTENVLAQTADLPVENTNQYRGRGNDERAASHPGPSYSGPSGPVESRPNITQALSLSAALDWGLEHNKGLKEFSATIREQEGVLVQAQAGWGPVVSVVATLDRQSSSLQPELNGVPVGTNSRSLAGLRVDQVLVDSGATKAAVQGTRLKLESTRELYRALVNDVVFAIRQQFAATLLAHEKVDVQRKSVELLEEEYRQEKQRLAAGTVSQFNVLRAEVAVANARTPLIKAQNEERLSHEELYRLMGISPESAGDNTVVPVLSGKLVYAKQTEEMPAMMKEAFENRPDLKALQLAVEAASAGAEFERSGYWPILLGYGMLGAEKDSTKSSLSEQLTGWRAGLELRWKIFDTWSTDGKVLSALSKREQAQYALEGKKHEVEVEVRRAYSSFVEALELVSASDKVVKQAEESVRLAKSRLAAGVGTQLELLDAQYALTAARLNFVESLYGYTVVLAQIDKVTGRAVKIQP